MALSREEKQQILTSFVKENQGKFYRSHMAKDALTEYTGDKNASKWIQELYGVKPMDYFTEQGVFMTEDQEKTYLENVLSAAKVRYDGKPPAKNYDSLVEENPDIDFHAIESIGQKNGMSLAQLFKAGIIANPYPTPEDRAKLMYKAVGILKQNGYKFLSLNSLLKDKWGKLKFGLDLPYPFEIKDYFCDWLEETFHKPAEDYLQEIGVLCSNPKSEADIILKTLIKAYASKVPASSIYTLEYKNKTYTLEDYLQYLEDVETKKGFDKEAANVAAMQVLIDHGILQGEKSIPSSPVTEIKPEPATAPQKTVTGSIYRSIDSYDVARMAAAAGLGEDGTGALPADKKYSVSINGKKLYVRTGFSRSWNTQAIQNACGFDAVEAINSMLSREQVVEKIRQADPNAVSDAEYYATAEFSLKKGDVDLTKRRLLFMKTIAAMLCEQSILEKVAMFAQKKKDGTYYKNRITRIASSMLAEYPNTVYEIVGRATSDDTLSLKFEATDASEETLFKSESDFLSTYQELFNLSAFKAK